MECKASGNPVPSVTWSKKVGIAGGEEELTLRLRPAGSAREVASCRAQVLIENSLNPQNVYKKLSDGPVLTLDRIKVNDAGVYQCTAENGVGKPVSLDMKLDVLCKFREFAIKFISPDHSSLPPPTQMRPM